MGFLLLASSLFKKITSRS